MTPILKDTENAAAPSASGVPATSAPKAAADASARPQPVALEVPVTVNGARTVDGSDKREPFSEKSATVLVFGHGAVIRISAVLAPGQLIFLTNEKTRKEVVCQVVKSKTDGNAIGYVELRFTEPAPGFWGMRFPSDTVLPQTPVRPAVPAPVPAPPKVAPPAPPVAVQPVMPAPAPGCDFSGRCVSGRFQCLRSLVCQRATSRGAQGCISYSGASFAFRAAARSHPFGACCYSSSHCRSAFRAGCSRARDSVSGVEARCHDQLRPVLFGNLNRRA